jgi:hypothetical protein
MNSLQDKIHREVDALPLNYQKEVLDFVLFIKNAIGSESDSDYLSKDSKIKQAIIDGLNTPLDACSDSLDW